MNSNFQKPKCIVKYVILSIISLLLFIDNVKAQTKAEKELKEIVYSYNNALQYDSAILVINKFINQNNSSNQNKFYGNLFMSFIYKRLQDYAQVNKYLDIAIKYGLQTKNKDYFIAIYNCQKSFAYFDVSDFSKADSMMQPFVKSNYKYLENEDRGVLMVQQAFIYLRNKNFEDAAKMYKAAEIFMQQNCPCDLPIVYANAIQLYEARKQYDKMEECYKKGVACADSCGILKYKMMCTQNMYFFYRKNGYFEKAIYYCHRWDSMNMIYRTNQNIIKLKEIDHQLNEKLKEAIISEQNAIILNNKIYVNKIIINVLIIGFFILVIVFVREYRIGKVKRNQRMQFTKQLLTKIEEERKRIASDLHDGISHDLISLKNTKQHFPEHLDNDIDTIIENIRSISRNLHPVMFERIGLKTTIEQMLERIQSVNRFLITSDISYSNSFDTNIELQLFRIIQEACTNMIKHSDAIAGRVSITDGQRILNIIIEDNGKGFNVSQKINDNNSYGIHNIILRTKLLGGKINIESNPTGTKINISIPNNPDEYFNSR
jgi:signal transduction histidine kinase